MKLIAIEEHFITPEVRAALGRLEGDNRDDSMLLNGLLGVDERLGEIGEERLRLMDASGVDVQVLSLTTPATQTFHRQKQYHLRARQTTSYLPQSRLTPRDSRGSRHSRRPIRTLPHANSNG